MTAVTHVSFKVFVFICDMFDFLTGWWVREGGEGGNAFNLRSCNNDFLI